MRQNALHRTSLQPGRALFLTAQLRQEMRLSARPHNVHHKGIEAFAQVSVAEDARFELARGCPQHAFQACALGH